MSNEKKIVHIAVAANQPCILKGDPGIGKTAFVQSLAEKQQIELFTIIASTHAPEDFLGLPIRTATEDVIWAPPRWGKEINRITDEGGKTMLFLDELSCAAPAVQAAVLRLIHERVLGEIVLPKSMPILAAMNPPETAAGGWDLEPPAANRMVHVDWAVNAKDWADGFMTGFPMSDEGKPLPSDWKLSAESNKAMVGTYVRAIGTDHLMAVPKDESKAGGAWPSPRTWEMTAYMWTAAELMYGNYGGALQHDIMKACVGEAEALVFNEWVQNMDLPDPVELLNNPENYEVPPRADKVAAVLSSVITTTVGQLSDEWWVSSWKILDKTAQSAHPDIAAAMAKTLAQVYEKNKELPNVSQYARSFGPILKAAGIYEGRTNNG